MVVAKDDTYLERQEHTLAEAPLPIDIHIGLKCSGKSLQIRHNVFVGMQRSFVNYNNL